MLKSVSRGARGRPAILGYAVAVFAVGTGVIGLAMMQARWQAPPHLSILLLAVVVTTRVAGAKPGLLATALAVLAFVYFMLRLPNPLADPTMPIVRLFTLAVVSAYVISITAAERARASALSEALEAVRLNNEALRTENLERKRTAEALHDSADRLQHLSRRLLAVQEEERRHLSRELHDEFGQLLFSINLHLQAAKSAAGPAAQPSLNESITLLQRAGTQVRGLALELRPMLLETAGLDATLRWLAEQYQQRSGVEIEVVGHANEVPGEVGIACFRVVQEALTNAARHAAAQHAWIELSQSEGLLKLMIRDDGVGFDVARTLEGAAAGSHLGLVGMRERVEILGGRLAIASRPERGTRIEVSFPLGQFAAAPVPQTAA